MSHYLKAMYNTPLNPHAQNLLAQYRQLLPIYEKMAELIPEKLKEFFAEAGIIVAAVEHRVKTESSLAGKLQLKGDKYQSIHVSDIVCHSPRPQYVGGFQYRVLCLLDRILPKRLVNWIEYKVYS